MEPKGRNYKSIGARGTVNVMSPEVVEVLDNCQISHRKSVQIIAAVANSLGVDVKTLILNPDSFRKIRDKVRKTRAENIMELFFKYDFTFITLHWDGKLLPDPNNTSFKVDRVPILASTNDLVQILDVPRLDFSTGTLQADALLKALQRWSLTDMVEAVCMDTTASNTGCNLGAATLLEELLHKDLLWMPCRHHIFEIVLGAIFTLKISVSTGPENSEFKKFQKDWPLLKENDYKSGVSDIHPLLVPQIEEKIAFIENYLQEKHPRDDYKQLLELSLLFLGSSKKMSLRKPGGCSNARWMSKAIYTLLMYLFRGSYDLAGKESDFLQMSQFIVFSYIEAWFTSPFPAKAPYHDLHFVKKLEDYKNIDAEISKVAIKKFKNHLWYLSAENCALSFFDESIPVETKKKMILALEKENIFDKDYEKKFSENRISCLLSEDIEYFISSDTLYFFKRFKLSFDFLKSDPSTWPQDDGYIKNRIIVNNLRVLNDVAERAVKLTSDFNRKSTTSEDQRQYLLQVVAHYKRENSDCSKSSIVKKYKKSEKED